jgi:hypothetical protein
MGRIGVSKRRPARKKMNQLAGDNGGRGVSPTGKAPPEPQEKLPEIEKMGVTTARGVEKKAPASKKAPKKSKPISET